MQIFCRGNYNRPLSSLSEVSFSPPPHKLLAPPPVTVTAPPPVTVTAPPPVTVTARLPVTVTEMELLVVTVTVIKLVLNQKPCQRRKLKL